MRPRSRPRPDVMRSKENYCEAEARNYKAEARDVA